MKRNTLLLGFLACTSMVCAQVGVNTTAPTATLEVVGKGATTTVPDGIVAPRVSKQQLAAKTAGTYGAPQTAAIVFVNDVTAPTGTTPSLTQVAAVTTIGYYYFNGTVWNPIGGTPTADTSIYLNDGTLAGNRIVTQGAATLAFNATSANAFSVDGTSLSVDAANHRAGFGTASPAATVDVVGKAATTTVPDGIVAPRISKQQLAAKTAGTYGAPQTAAVVFVNDVTAPTGTTPSLAQVASVNTIGYYYFNGTVWNPIGGTPTVDTSIYLNDGTLAGNRIVTQGASTLTFNASAVNAFSVDATSLSVDAANHRAGFGTAAPAATVDVVGKAATTTVPDGIVAPRISKQQLAAKTAGTYGAPQTAAVVFVNDVTAPTGTTPSLAQVASVNTIGYYYFNGTAWNPIGGTPTVDTSIYLNDGTLAGNRTVTQGAATLTFNASAVNAFSVDGTTLSVDAANHRIGIGTAAPLTELHVAASTAQANRYNLFDAPSSTNQYALIALRNTSPLATGNYSLLGFTNSGTAAGGANWGVGSIRTGAASTTGAEEDFYIGNSLGGTLIERFRISSAGNVGIGTSLPQRPLHVNANTGPVRFENLATLATGTASSGLVIDSNGDIYKNNTVSVEGQILRVGLNAVTYTTLGEVGLRFSANDSAAEMGNAPNVAPNFINTIVGATITDGVSATAGQGSVARTTDQITLQPGVYKLQVRLVGNFAVASSTNTVFLKAIVNNNEYSLINGASNSNQTTVFYFDDYINITGASAQTVDFSISPGGNNFTTSSNASPGTGNSYRSLILIQRLR